MVKSWIATANHGDTENTENVQRNQTSTVASLFLPGLNPCNPRNLPMLMPKLDGDVDALFRLPVPEFVGARKTLSARLKKDGRAADADRVKLLPKPSISAWAVNQLYWQHREAFDRLIATGQRFHKAQTSGKVAEMRQRSTLGEKHSRNSLTWRR